MTFYVVHICLGFEQVLQEKVLETNWRFVGGQCDQMVRLCVQYLAIYNHENCQRLFKIHRSGQIWSQWWWTQTWSPLTRCFKPSQWVQLALVDSRQFMFWTFKICNLQAQSRLISAQVVVIVGRVFIWHYVQESFKCFRCRQLWSNKWCFFVCTKKTHQLVDIIFKILIER